MPLIQQPNSINPAPPAYAPPDQASAPQNMQWMEKPVGIPGCPSGLEYLTQVDQLLIKQKVELFEAFTDIETKNKYAVTNSMGQAVYKAKEDSSCCARNCIGKLRHFDMNIYDNNDQEVIHIERPMRCDSCWYPCCLQQMTVTSPVTGEPLGKLKQRWHPIFPTYDIQDANGNTILTMKGPFCTFSCCGDVEFQVLANDGTEIGKITKQWSGLIKEHFTDADNFGVSFPLDLDVKVKATLLAGVFLIDFMFFEKAGEARDEGIECGCQA